MYRPLLLAVAVIIQGCQSMPDGGTDAITPGTALELTAPIDLAVADYGIDLQGGRPVTERDQVVWDPLCRIQTRFRDRDHFTLPPGRMTVGKVTTLWRFMEISVHKYSAKLTLAAPYAGITGFECEIWGGPHWKSGEFGLAELKTALEPMFRVRPASPVAMAGPQT